MDTTQHFDLEDLYKKIADAITQIDFSKLWEGFKPLKFALYNDEEWRCRSHRTLRDGQRKHI